MNVTYCPHCATALHLQHDGERERQTCSSCGHIHYDNPTPVVAALVEHEGAVVLARGVGWPSHFFGLITGFLERGETPEQGVLREVQEELGLVAEIAGLIGVYAFHKKNQLILAYHVKATGSITLNHELEEFKHVLPEALQPWPQGTGLAVRDWMAARGLYPQEP